jgi:Papain-like cysteine protease AvrRpt2
MSWHSVSLVGYNQYDSDTQWLSLGHVGDEIVCSVHLDALKDQYLVLGVRNKINHKDRMGYLNVLVNGSLVSMFTWRATDEFLLEYLLIPTRFFCVGENNLVLRLGSNHSFPLINELVVTDFVAEKQELSNWCWAAVTLSLLKYYGHTTFSSQRELVQFIIDKKYCCNGRGCGVCNRPWYIGEVLHKVGILGQSIPSPITQSELDAALKHRNPVVMVVKWDSIATGHTLIIGHKVDDHYVVWDTRTPSFYKLPYAELLVNTKQRFRWVNTFLTTFPSAFP